jgi:hypothetical protein
VFKTIAARKEDMVMFLRKKGAVFREEKLSDTDYIRFECSEGFPVLGSATVDALM